MVMDVEEVLHALDADGTFDRNAGGYWARWPQLDVRAMARSMRDREVRLVTITARPDPDIGFRIIYHWDAGATVVNISTRVTADGGVPTIADLIPGADWAEREIRDYYGLEFHGRVETPTLMLREGDPAGLFTRTAEVARDIDPATTARRAAESEGSESK
jgi:Ni,Fe-hydrogenase III component G